MPDTYTPNLSLKKPGYDSPADIADINANMDKIDDAVANAGKVKSINGKAPDASGSVTLEMGDIDGLTEAIEGAGSVKTVAGVAPDSAGNVALTADKIGYGDNSNVGEALSSLKGDKLDKNDIGMTLLWTNATPTSSFATHKVYCDLIGYDVYEVVFKLYATDDLNRVVNVRAPVKNSCFTPTMPFGQPVKFATRYIEFADDGLTFSDGKIYTAGGESTPMNDNTAFIPMYIYGIKGVLTL